jgi:hypothetical protein
MRFMIVEVPKTLFGCLLLGWTLVLYGLKAQRSRTTNEILVTVSSDVQKS